MCTAWPLAGDLSATRVHGMAPDGASRISLTVVSLGHNMSHADGNSTEGESIAGRNPAQTGTGCYRNFDHFPRHRRSDSSTLPCLPSNEGPPGTGGSPGSQRRLYAMVSTEEEEEEEEGLGGGRYRQSPGQAVAPLAQEEANLVGGTPKECVSPTGESKKSDTLKKTEKIEMEMPAEFECCFCTSKDFKEFVDAENLMPLTTSDFKNPVCLEMRILKESEQNLAFFPEVDVEKKNTLNGTDLHSMDNDVTADTPNVIDSNLYVNPLDKSGNNSPVISSGVGRSACVKKSASGDTGLRSLGTSPMDEGFKGFEASERGSRGRPRTRFGDFCENESQESLEKKRKTSFVPSRSLASATRIINQHLFGLQNLAQKTGRNSGSKSSLSVDSIDSRTSPQLELHRRSKSILKKSDSSGNRCTDPESERLISDNVSGFEVSFGNEYSPNKRMSSPPVNRRSVSQKAASKNSLTYQHELERTRLLKSQLFLLDDILIKEKQACNNEPKVDSNKLKMCGDSMNEAPLYICPPPPPLENSPTEDTRLLYMGAAKQANNTVQIKGHNQTS
ncbi:unnamed protein product [Phaedon cochleariae]|uniref:Uncharacterized protein n=1 Tax=Phaedon cochleariae TaxID=80249 RepID=A0A9N9SLM6_PHACE|nr:unnamed protein product [Phaedon cochleariae]